MMHDIAFLIVLGLGGFLFWKERKARLLAESQVQALAGRVATVAAESANANAEMVAAQAPLVKHHEMLLDYLRKNEGKSIDEAKDALKYLMEGIETARIKVLTAPVIMETPDSGEITRSHRLLHHLRQNPGASIAEAEEALKNG